MSSTLSIQLLSICYTSVIVRTMLEALCFLARCAFVKMHRRVVAMMFIRLFVWDRRAL